MINKTILITGATDGLGKQTAMQLAKMGASILMHGRNQSKLETVKKEIVAHTGNLNIQTFTADFQSLRQVSQMADQINQGVPRLDLLINNAGIFMRKRFLTEDGFEMTFGVNHLAAFLLTNQLLPLLKRSAPARIITISSMGHRFVNLNLKNLQGERFYWGWVAYCRSKLMNILFTAFLSKRLENSGVSAFSIHPGIVQSRLTQKASITWGLTPSEGAASIVNLAACQNINAVSGAYFNRTKPTKPSLLARNLKLQEKLWELSENMTESYL